jgi:hypothetical protein
LWDVLLADPTAELRTVSLQDPAAIGAGGGGGSPIDPNAPPPGQTLQDGLRRLDVAETVLTDAGVTAEQLSAAAAEIADNGAVADAAAHAGVTSNNELAVEVSRSVVATVLRAAASSAHPDVKALYDAAARDALVEAVAPTLDRTDRLARLRYCCTLLSGGSPGG